MIRLFTATVLVMFLVCNQTSARSFVSQNADAVQELAQPEWDTLRRVAWSPDGEHLAVSTSRGIWLYNAANLEASSQQIADHYGIFSPNWTHLALTSEDNSLRLLDAESGSEQVILEGHDYPIETITFSPDGTLMAATSLDNSGAEGIWLWDVTTGSRIRVLDVEESINVVSFSPDGRLLAAAGESGSVFLWYVESGTPIASLTQYNGSVNDLIFGENSIGDMTLAMALESSLSGDDGIQIYAISDFFGPKSVGLDCDTTTEELTCPQHRILGAGEDVYSMAISLDRRLIAAGNSSNAVQVYDLVTGTEQVSFTNDYRVITMAFSPDNTTLAWGSADGTVRIWNSCTETTTGL